MKSFSNQDFSKRLIMYLDGELTKQEERELLGQIQTSPDHLAQFNKEKSFREFIRSKVSRRKVSPALVQSIKSQIKTPGPSTTT